MLFSATDHAKEKLLKALAFCDTAERQARNSKDVPFDLDRISHELRRAEQEIHQAESEDRLAYVDHHGKSYDAERIKARIYFIQGSVATHPDMPDDILQKGIGVLERLTNAHPRDAEAQQALSEAKRRSEYRSNALTTVSPTQIGSFSEGSYLQRNQRYLEPVAGPLIDITPQAEESGESDEWIAVVVIFVGLLVALAGAAGAGRHFTPSYQPNYEPAPYRPYVPPSRPYYPPPRPYYPPPRPYTYTPPPRPYYPPPRGPYPPPYGYRPPRCCNRYVY